MSRGPKKKAGTQKQIESLTHTEAKRKNIPTAELQSAAQRAEEIAPFAPVVYPRRHPLAQGETRPRDADLDPQLVWKGTRVRLTAEQIKKAAESGYIDLSDAQLTWRGKDQQDWSDLVVNAPPLYIQEKIHPKAIIDDLTRRTKAKREAESDIADLFHDFNGIDPEAKTEFYQHDQNWSNRFILGDSLQVMASLAERESLRGQVQCIYFDPPYGIKFNSNWQVSTRSRDVKDGKVEEISREPEQVRAFRDTWKDGIHSYLTYLRDRLTAMRDLLTESGSIFVQIGEDNVHLLRAVLDEVFGADNFCAQIDFKKTAGLASDFLATSKDYILWYARKREAAKFRRLFSLKEAGQEGATQFTWIESPDCAERRSFVDADQDNLANGWQLISHDNLTSTGFATTTNYPLEFLGKQFVLKQANQRWKTLPTGMQRLKIASRLMLVGNTPRYVRKLADFPVFPITDVWSDTGVSGFADPRVSLMPLLPV